jgi:hypothetical protein
MSNTFELRIELPADIERETIFKQNDIKLIIGEKEYKIKQTSAYSYYKKFEIEVSK